MSINKSKIPLAALSSFFIFTFFFISCRKTYEGKVDDTSIKFEENFQSTISEGSGCDLSTTVCEDCVFQDQIEESDSTDQYPTILGGTYVNPYSISVMTESYNAIYSTNIQTLPATDLYIRFKPETAAHLILLDSLDLEIYDYPLNRTVIQDGEFWPEAYVGLGQNEFPWLYTVVKPNFQFPHGITYQILQTLYIPDDDGPLEDYAFSITGNSECSGVESVNISSSGKDLQAMVPICPVDYHWDYTLLECVPDNCPLGYYWNGSECVPNTPLPPPTNLYPRGMINFNTYDDYGVIAQTAPLKYTRIVAKRFFKIDKTYTDANGNFQLTKRFPKKVTLIVKFKTSSLSIRQEHSNFGFWKKWFPIRKNIGTYRGNNLQNLNYVFEKSSTSSKKWRTRHWIAAVALNTAVETRNFLSSNSLTQISERLKIRLLAPSHSETAQYEFIKRSYHDIFNDIILEWSTSDMNSLTTSKVTINVAQQLGINYLWNVSGNNSFTFYEYSLQNNSPEYGRFGNGVPNPINSYNSELVAMWQSFAQHLGHTIAARVFGWGETIFQLQGKVWLSGNGLSSSAKYLEQFNPSIGPPNDYLNWIPVGLINDLIDNNTDQVPIIDNVSGFTYLNIQAAFNSEPLYMVDFKNAIKAIKPSQATAIDQLFNSYGY